MNETQRDIPASNDPLGEALCQLRLNGSLYCRSTLTAPWGMDIPVMDAKMMFHFVTAGGCWLQVDGAEPRFLQQGCLALVPQGNGHTIFSDSTAPTTGLFDIPVQRISERYELMHYGGGGELTELTCGVVSFDQVAGRKLMAQLPQVLIIDSWDDESDRWLQSTLRFIAHEAGTLKLGGETIITHLADIIVIQAIRAWVESAPEANQGWLAALKDRQIGMALAAIHREPEKDWTVDSLARVVGMSRSGFSARFTDLVGDSAKRYITHWRMQIARAKLANNTVPIAVLAEQLGYQSEAAFSRAFKRVVGVPPGSVR
jgi:AraC-like DNA-binding protein